MKGRIRVDATVHSVVVTCTDCPHWFAFRFTRAEGWKAAREHERRAHPGAQQAAKHLAPGRDTPSA